VLSVYKKGHLGDGGRGREEKEKEKGRRKGKDIVGMRINDRQGKRKRTGTSLGAQKGRESKRGWQDRLLTRDDETEDETERLPYGTGGNRPHC